MDSNIESQFHHHHHHQQQKNHNQEPNSGLLRFRSAPTTLFNDYTPNSNDYEEFGGRFGDELIESYHERKPDRLNFPNEQCMVSTSSSMERSNSLDMDRLSTRQGSSDGLYLNRQISSPAGFFNILDPQNGYTMMRVSENFRVENVAEGETSPCTSRPSMSHLPRILEIVNENVKETKTNGFDNPAGFSFASWNKCSSDANHSDANHLSEPEKNGGVASRPNYLLSHHLSLPKTSAHQMPATESLLHFQDTIPCKVSAKRGFATHPRSIAERVRRNRISEKMRKLQELVPSMDKQTNTADMLDLAVEYIKNLRNEYKVLSDNRAKCKCVNLQYSVTNQAA